MQKDQIMMCVSGQMMQKVSGNRVVTLTLRLFIAQAFGEQFARPLNRVLSLTDFMADVIPPAGKRLTRAAAGLSVLDPLR